MGYVFKQALKILALFALAVIACIIGNWFYNNITLSQARKWLTNYEPEEDEEKEPEPRIVKDYGELVQDGIKYLYSLINKEGRLYLRRLHGDEHKLKVVPNVATANNLFSKIQAGEATI